MNFLRNIAENPGEFAFQDLGPISDLKLAGHTTCPTVADWDGTGKRTLIVGAEDSHCYRLGADRQH